MTDLSDKAQQGPNVVLAPDLIESHWKYESTELVEADELTDEDEFPEYGEFLEVEERSPVDGTFRGTSYIQVPQDLAQWLVANTEAGDWWQVTEISGGGEERWTVEARVIDTDET